MFPPFEFVHQEDTEPSSEEQPEGQDWEADVRIESWLQDPAMLWIEMQGTWHEPMQWSDQVTEEIVDHLRIASEFVDNKLIPFLKHRDHGAD